MHDDALQQLLEDHGETITVVPPGGSGAYPVQALFEETEPQPWRHDTRGSEKRRHARATVRTADCATVPEVLEVPWTIAARGVSWKVIGLTSGPVSLILTLQSISGGAARGPRAGGL